MMLADLIDPIAKARSAIITGALCVAVCLPVGYCSGYQAMRNKATAERALANVEATKRAATASEAAGVEHVADALAIAEHEGKLTDAILETPDTAPDAVRVQLGCERLRTQGTADADLPAPCRPARRVAP